MMNTKSLVVIGMSLISAVSFAEVCTTQMVNGYGTVVREFNLSGVNEREACKEAMKSCRISLRQMERRGQISNGDCQKVGVTNNGGGVDHGDNNDNGHTDPVDNGNNTGGYAYELDQLKRVINNGGWRARQQAAKELKRYPSIRALKMAIKLSVLDNDSDVKRAAANSRTSLENTVIPNVSPARLVEKLEPLTKKSSWKIRQLALLAMNKANSAESLLVMLEMKNDNDIDVRNAAQSGLNIALGAYDFVNVMEVFGQEVVALATNGGTETKVAAVKIISKSGIKRLVADLIPSLNDSSWKVRQEVAKAIGKERLRRAIVALIKKSNDNDSDVRNAVNNAISKIISANSFTRLSITKVNQLEDLYHSSNSWRVRLKTVKALGATLNYAVKDTLYRALDDSDVDVRRAAQEELRKF